MRLERLWTPWRMAFIEREAEGTPGAGQGCFLCTKPAEGPAHDRENLILYRGQRAYVLLNLYPYNTGHVMVAPYRHTADLVGLSQDEQLEMMRLTRYCVRVLDTAFHPEAYNIGMNLGKTAGAGVAETAAEGASSSAGAGAGLAATARGAVRVVSIASGGNTMIAWVPL